jgi:hypothetical protein
VLQWLRTHMRLIWESLRDAAELDHRGESGACRVSNPLSYRGALTCGAAGRFTSCHLGFVSNSCHFLSGATGLLEGVICQSPADASQAGTLRHVTNLVSAMQIVVWWRTGTPTRS